MKKKFVLSTKKSLFDPIEIEIDGKTYQSNKLSRALFDELKQYEEDATKGNIDALYKQVNVIFGIEEPVLAQLDIREIEALIEYATNKIFHPEKEKKETAKNGSKSGDKS